ncbi:MAG: cytochrome P450 [Myxococcota bacterium]
MLRMLQWMLRRDTILRALGPVLGPFNPFTPQHRRDPHQTWRRLREADPVAYNRVFGAWLCTRYEDVLHVLRDDNFTTDRSEVPIVRWITRKTQDDPIFQAVILRSLLTLDGAEHARLRGLVSKAFTPRRVERLRPRLEEMVEELLDRAGEAGEMEVVQDLANPLPVNAIAELMGVPSDDRDFFRACSTDLVQLLDPLQGKGGAKPMRRAAHALFDYFRPLLAERRESPRDDLLSAMIAAEQDGESLSELDLLSLSALLLVAGHETTGNLIASAVTTLLRHPDERKRLQDDPGLLRNAIDEFLRFESPIQFTDRAAKADCEIRGKAIRGGQLVGAVLGAANRDPERFPDPDRLDLGRPDNHHLAFGQGNHFCLGSQLAKLEAEIAIGALLRRFPDFDGPPDPPDWRRSMIVRGPTAVPIRLA